MRLFIALDCSIVEDYLINIQKRFSDAGLKKVKKFHMTLKFLGEVENPKIIIDKIRYVKFTPIDARLSSMGVFPKLSHAKVLWIGVEPKDEIIRLQKSIKAVLPDWKSGQSFRPHITLARINKRMDEGFFNTLETQIEPIPIKFDSFHLIKSILTPEGPLYEVLETFY